MDNFGLTLVGIPCPLSKIAMFDYPGSADLGSITILISVGCLAGFLNTIAGGGSMLSLPTLLFLEVPSAIANGTNRIAIIAQALPAAIVYFRKGFRDIAQSIFLSILLLPGSILGAYIGTQIEDKVFDRIVATILAITAISMFFGKANKSSKSKKPTHGSIKRRHLVYPLVFLLGFYGGFIHIGIGFLIMFILHKIGGLSLIATNTHKILIVVPYSVASLLIFWGEVSVLWYAGISLALGNMFGGWIGAHVTIKDGGKYIAPFYQATILAMVAILVVR